MDCSAAATCCRRCRCRSHGVLSEVPRDHCSRSDRWPSSTNDGFGGDGPGPAETVLTDVVKRGLLPESDPHVRGVLAPRGMLQLAPGSIAMA